MPEELIPIVLFVGLFTFLSISVVTKMVQNVYRTKATLKFIEGLVDRGYSASEIERILKICKGTTCGEIDVDELKSRITHPVAPIKQPVHY